MRIVTIFALAGLAAACTGGDDTGATGDTGAPDDTGLPGYEAAEFSTEADARAWGQMSSTPAVFFASFAYSAGPFPEDTASVSCPQISVDGNTTTYTASGCTDANGITWDGTAVVERDGTAASFDWQSLTWSGTEADCGCSDCSYSVTVEGTATADDGTGDFSVDLTSTLEGNKAALSFPTSDSGDDCDPAPGELVWDYSGTFPPGEDTGDYTGLWEGSGLIGIQSWGQVHATTEDEEIDFAVCPDGALSGSTTIRAGGNTATFTYDGQSDCDTASQWSYNGEDRGEIAGVFCSTAGATPGWGALSLLGLALLPLWRRRQAGRGR